jgi:hypothetical protein
MYVKNPEPRPLLLTNARFEISKSDIDETPIVVVEENRNILSHLAIHNFGWGKAKELIVGFGVAPIGDYNSSDIFTRPGAFETKPTDLERRALIPISDIVPEELKRQGRVTVFGKIRYKDNGGADVEFPFRTRVSFSYAPEAYQPATAQYQLRLRAGQGSYSLNVPISQSVKPLETDRFDLVVTSDKSANYTLVSYLLDTGKRDLIPCP